MSSKYTRLSEEDREEISIGIWAEETFTAIAKRIGRSVSTVTREVWSKCSYSRCYRATRSHTQVMQFRRRQKQVRKLDKYPQLRSYVLDNIREKKWSPEEVANRLKTDYPLDMTMRISHESIYTYIYCLPRTQLRKELISSLRKERNMRKSRKKDVHSKRGGIQEAISIDERPKETEDRTIPGHWEGDLVMGNKQSNSSLGTLVERTTRYTLLVPLKAHDAYTVRTEFAKAIKSIPKDLKRSLTYDRGSEMAEHKLFTTETRVQVYFADPHSPWQRGTNENTNGLVRQFFPKGTDFNLVTKKEIKHVQDLLNGRPRKVLDWKMPDEVFIPLLKA